MWWSNWRGVALGAMVALTWLASGAWAQAPLVPPPSLAGVVIDLSHAHHGRYSRHAYSLAARGGKLAVLFAPLPLADDPSTLRGAATHLVRFAFDTDLDAVVPLTRDVAGVPTLAFPTGDRTFLVMPIRNGRGLVHSLMIWVDTPAGSAASDSRYGRTAVASISTL